METKKSVVYSSKRSVEKEQWGPIRGLHVDDRGAFLRSGQKWSHCAFGNDSALIETRKNEKNRDADHRLQPVEFTSKSTITSFAERKCWTEKKVTNIFEHFILISFLYKFSET